ncbi:hypothetical protein EJ02DRAFT_220367 [Clathrospora elynae]|uniref:Uncharacterized protein n=1 Tax=Clathrospora elynae TaxID=706981 RepID=A0A6A5S3E8_9PLEO|nr:hypothetical protein EJ02DRAFT_220367 [Clathrospora elynae]
MPAVMLQNGSIYPSSLAALPKIMRVIYADSRTLPCAPQPHPCAHPVQRHNNFDYIIRCTKSPDLIIIETWTGPLKDYFFYRRTCHTKEEGVTWFYQV